MEIPDEIWIHIFQFLPPKVLHKTVSLVCKHWLKLIRNGVRHLKVTTNLFIKYFGLEWNFVYGIKISDKKLNDMMLEYLKLWPYLQSLEVDYVGKTPTKTLLNKSLDEFKKMWNLPFLQSLHLDAYWHLNRVHTNGITYKSNATMIDSIHMFCDDSRIAEFAADFKLFTETIRSNRVKRISIIRSKHTEMMAQSSDFGRTLGDFLTMNINNINELRLHEHNAKSVLLSVLEPLMKPSNYKLREVFLSFEGRGMSKDFKLLQNLKHLTTLKISQASFRFEDFNLLSQTCSHLEVFHFEGSSWTDVGSTYLPVSRLTQFLSGFKSLQTIKDIRITNISPVIKTRSPQDIEEYSHVCVHPQDCLPVQDNFKEDAEIHLLDVMKNLYSPKCFILILFYNVHCLSLINNDGLSRSHKNLYSLLLAKDREDYIRVEYIKYDLLLQFPEYIEKSYGPEPLAYSVSGKLRHK